jgi:protein-disulfide isomerase
MGKPRARCAVLLALTGVVSLVAQTSSPPALREAQGGEQSRTARPANEAATAEKIVRYLRERFDIPKETKVTVSPFRNSPVPDFYEVTLTVDDGKERNTQKFYVSKDSRYLVGGNIFTLGEDPKREVARSISLQDQPSLGPANAPVTIVEYSDLQCPNCALFHEYLEKKVVPAYGDKVRVVFKEFPLVGIHDWALTGSIAAQCVYQLDPAAFLPFRSMAFENQGSVNANNARDMLLHFGAQVGIDNLKLAACIDSKASLPRVEASQAEGQALGIGSVPTSFVNGKQVAGAVQPAEFFKILDEALRGAQ